MLSSFENFSDEKGERGARWRPTDLITEKGVVQFIPIKIQNGNIHTRVENKKHNRAKSLHRFQPTLDTFGYLRSKSICCLFNTSQKSNRNRSKEKSKRESKAKANKGTKDARKKTSIAKSEKKCGFWDSLCCKVPKKSSSNFVKASETSSYSSSVSSDSEVYDRRSLVYIEPCCTLAEAADNCRCLPENRNKPYKRKSKKDWDCFCSEDDLLRVKQRQHTEDEKIAIHARRDTCKEKGETSRHRHSGGGGAGNGGVVRNPRDCVKRQRNKPQDKDKTSDSVSSGEVHDHDGYYLDSSQKCLKYRGRSERQQKSRGGHHLYYGFIEQYAPLAERCYTQVTNVTDYSSIKPAIREIRLINEQIRNQIKQNAKNLTRIREKHGVGAKRSPSDSRLGALHEQMRRAETLTARVGGLKQVVTSLAANLLNKTRVLKLRYLMLRAKRNRRVGKNLRNAWTLPNLQRQKVFSTLIYPRNSTTTCFNFEIGASRDAETQVRQSIKRRGKANAKWPSFPDFSSNYLEADKFKPLWTPEKQESCKSQIREMPKRKIIDSDTLAAYNQIIESMLDQCELLTGERPLVRWLYLRENHVEASTRAVPSQHASHLVASLSAIDVHLKRLEERLLKIERRVESRAPSRAASSAVSDHYHPFFFDYDDN